MPSKVVPIRRALLSVSDKSGLIDLAKALHKNGVKLLSTGGTATAIRDADIPVKDVSEITNFPEMMDGRVKTLHPMIHGGLLALRDNPEHVATMDEHGIKAIDLVVVNLYPFEATVAAGADFQTCIENIDIGGPAMIRSAAKNYGFVAVVTDTEDYAAVIDALEKGGTTAEFRQNLSQIAYARTAAYDAAVSTWMAGAIKQPAPRRRAIAGTLTQTLRYGENPHQSAAFYTDGSSGFGVGTATQHQGKELSYNNINDTDAAFELVAEFDPTDGPACAIIKHANPCGVARSATMLGAYKAAFDTDNVSPFGGIIALNQELDAATASEIVKIFTEVVIAPSVTSEAMGIFATKKNLRLLTTGGLPDVTTSDHTWRKVAGGYLVQDRDNGVVSMDDLKVVTQRQPSDAELADLMFAWKVAKHVKSNAIVYVKDWATVGIGAGQMSRVDSTRIAARKAQDMADFLGLDKSPTHGSVVASDAFFPFADGLITAAEAGATAIIQPGGSMRDAEVIEAANAAGLAMVFTDMRHFRH